MSFDPVIQYNKTQSAFLKPWYHKVLAWMSWIVYRVRLPVVLLVLGIVYLEASVAQISPLIVINTGLRQLGGSVLRFLDFEYGWIAVMLFVLILRWEYWTKGFLSRNPPAHIYFGKFGIKLDTRAEVYDGKRYAIDARDP